MTGQTPAELAADLDRLTDQLVENAVAATDTPQDACDVLHHAAARLLVRQNGGTVAQQVAISIVGGGNFIATVVHEVHRAAALSKRAASP